MQGMLMSDVSVSINNGTMKYYKLMQILCFALLTQAMYCGEGFDDAPTYRKNPEGRPEHERIVTIGVEQFKERVVGKGWKWKKTRRITEDGELEEFTFAGNGYPQEFYFTADSVTVFKYYADQNVRQTEAYIYNQTRNVVESPIIKYMQVSELRSIGVETMMTVEWAGVMGYLENHYEEMLPFELNARMLGFKDVEQ